MLQVRVIRKAINGAVKRCAELVKEKGLKGGAYQSEFNKCMTDSAGYK